MSDLFHEDVPDSYILKVVQVMQLANWHTYQVLTKRPERMYHLLNTKIFSAAREPHIWWGVSVENRQQGIPRVDYLRRTPVSVRFLSIEPLLESLGQIDLTDIGWVIVGGESGRKARPMEKSWVIEIRDQCQELNIPFFFKQWGGRQKSKTGRELDGRTYDAVPQYRPRVVPSPESLRTKRAERELLQ